MVDTVLLIRHARPGADPAVPRGEWRLDDAGRQAAVELGVVLAPLLAGRVIVASTEPKAIETVAAVTGRDPQLTDVGFGEVEHPWIDLAAEKHAVSLAYLGGKDVADWEPAPAVVDRFAAALDRIEARDVVIGTHGMAAALWTASVVPGVDAPTLWSQLRLPDAWIVDLQSRSMRQAGS